MRTQLKAHLTLISLLILAASAVPIDAADPDVYMNSAVPSVTVSSPPSTATAGEAAIDQRHVVGVADADVYLRSDPSIGGVSGSASDVARFMEVLADALASLLH